MALPFFKKNDEKMPTRPAVKPTGRAPSPPAAAPASQPPPDEDFSSLDFTGIQVVEEVDPLVAAIEGAALAFANDRGEETERTLKAGIQSGAASPEAERLWLMLFDFYLVSGRRDAFAPLELVYAKRFEKQPPVWRGSASQQGPKTDAVAAIGFKGNLLGGNGDGFTALETWLAGDAKGRMDLSKVTSVDPAGCDRFLEALGKARRQKKHPEFAGCDVLAELLKPMIAGGDPNQSLWRLLLECYQHLGRHEEFENLAIEFAVTFEISPPSWEESAVSAKAGKSTKTVEAATKAKAPSDDAFRLSGEIRGGGFGTLETYLTEQAHPVVDFSEVTRMDFPSAGTLLNLLAPHRQRGVEVILRHPNRLVAELMNLMGIAELARIVFAKR